MCIRDRREAQKCKFFLISESNHEVMYSTQCHQDTEERNRDHVSRNGSWEDRSTVQISGMTNHWKCPAKQWASKTRSRKGTMQQSHLEASIKMTDISKAAMEFLTFAKEHSWSDPLLTNIPTLESLSHIKDLCQLPEEAWSSTLPLVSNADHSSKLKTGL